jgi:V/A-type H+-transporting ATPase subunit D
MARLAYNKSTLKKENDKLDLYKHFLPALDLKRQQLLATLKKERSLLAEIEKNISVIQKEAEKWLGFVNKTTFWKMITIDKIEHGEENLLGIHLPTLLNVTISVLPYSPLATPLWTDSLVTASHQILEFSLRRITAIKRVTLLEEALQVITQRVNLFDKVLIPQTSSNLRQIHVVLGDQERAGVVRAKIAKAKHK